MAQHKVAVITGRDADMSLVEEGLAGLDYDLEIHPCESEGETIEAIKGSDVIINLGVPMPKAVIDEIDTAQAIVSIGHGFDRTDDKAATEKGVMVVNTAGFVTEEVADHAILLLLAVARKLVWLHNRVKGGEWAPTGSELYEIPRLYGRVLGLVGFGSIARATANRAKPFGLDVVAYDPYVSQWMARELRVELVPSLEELAARSDFVSAHMPLNDQTMGMLGEAFFKAMKPTAFLINTCRGPVVDEVALINALESREIAGAGLDVFEQEPTSPDNPLLKMDNVVVTPHSAGASDLAVSEGMQRLGQEAARILEGTWPMSLVNPQVRSRLPARPSAVNR